MFRFFFFPAIFSVAGLIIQHEADPMLEALQETVWWFPFPCGFAALFGVVLWEVYHFTLSLQHTKNDGLPGSAAPAYAAAFPTDIGFIHFHSAMKRVLAVYVSHVFADDMRHSQGSRIGHAQVAVAIPA